MKPVLFIEHVAVYDYVTETEGRAGQYFLIDMDKVPAFAHDHDFEFGYVQHIFEAFEGGKLHFSTSHKYSLSDVTDWYKDIIIADDTVTPVAVFEYEVG